MQVDHHTWTMSPVSYQPWNDDDYTRFDEVSFQIYHVRKPFPPNIVHKEQHQCTDNDDIPFCFIKENSSSLFNANHEVNRKFQPSLQCTMLHMSNMAQSQWIPVHCHQPILSSVACFKKSLQLENKTVFQPNAKFCQKSDFMEQNLLFFRMV